MSSRFSLVISIFFLFFAPHTSLARDVRFDVVIYDIPANGDYDLVLFFEFGTDQIQREATWQRRKDFSVGRSNNTVSLLDAVLPEGSNEIMLHGFLTVEGERRFFPIIRKIIETDEANVIIDETIFVPRKDYIIASTEGYPFLSGANYNLRERDVTSVINASEILVRRSEWLGIPVPDSLWKSMYTLFQSNANTIASSSQETLPKVTSLLATYAARSTDQAFVDFYADFLNNLVGGSFGFVKISGQNSEDFILDQQKNNLQRNTMMAFSTLNRSLTAYLDSRDYERCIELASFAFEEISSSISQNEDSWRKLGARLLAKSIFNSMITATNCSQLIYVVDGEGQKTDPQGGTAFVRQKDWGSTFIESFLLMNDVSKDILALDIESNPSIQNFVVWYRQ